jgi:hypothetical protein
MPQTPVSSHPLGKTVWRDQSSLSHLVQQDFDVLQFAENTKVEGATRRSPFFRSRDAASPSSSNRHKAVVFSRGAVPRAVSSETQYRGAAASAAQHASIALCPKFDTSAPFQLGRTFTG